MFLPFLLIANSFAEPSTCEISTAELAGIVDAALDDYSSVREQSFTKGRVEANLKLACLTERASNDLIQDYHLLKALTAFLDGDKVSTVASLRALLALDPEYQIPATIAPVGHPFQRLLVEARSTTETTERELIDPDQGLLLLNDVEGKRRSLQRASLVQWVDRAGTPCWSAYLQPNQSVPLWVLAYASEEDGLEHCISERRITRPPPPAPTVADAEESENDDNSGADFFSELEAYMDTDAAIDSVAGDPSLSPPSATAPSDGRSGSPLLRPLPLATMGSGLAAGGLLAASLITRGQLLDTAANCGSADGCGESTEDTLARLEAMEQRTNGLGYGAQACGGLALGLGVLSITLSF